MAFARYCIDPIYPMTRAEQSSTHADPSTVLCPVALLRASFASLQYTAGGRVLS